MRNQKIFKRYIQLADVLGQMFANFLEVAVHDFSDLEHSVIYIANGHISGRGIGAPATDLGLRRLYEGDIPDVLVNYSNRSRRGNRLKSASLAIRDDKGAMIGAFCLNFDISAFEYIQESLTSLLAHAPNALAGEEDLYPEREVNEDIYALVKNYLSKHNLQNARLTYADKQEIVLYLYKLKCFRQKGAIQAIAKALNITRQSVYNYLKKKGE